MINFIKTFFKEFYDFALFAMVVMWLFLVTFEFNNPGFVLFIGIVALIVTCAKTVIDSNNLVAEQAKIIAEQKGEKKEEIKEEK